MSTSKELRIENLRALVAEFKTATEVAARAGAAPMYLSQILTGAKSSTGKARGIGDDLARRLETGCEKELGWLDRDHKSAEPPLPLPEGMHEETITTEERRLIAFFRRTDKAGQLRIMLTAERQDVAPAQLLKSHQS